MVQHRAMAMDALGQHRRRWRASVSNVLVVLCLVALGGLIHVRSGAGPLNAQARLAGEPLPPVPRPISIYAGECGDLGDVAWPLNDLSSPDGDAAGSDDYDRTEYSFTANVPLTIDALLAGPYAIDVHESADHPEVSLACANIGGVADSVGTLVVGLRLQAGIDVTGIAVLSPSPSDSSRTLISVFITGSALGHEHGTIQPTATAAPGQPAPPIVDTPIPGQPTAAPTQVVEEPTEIEHEPTEIEREPTEDGDHGGGGDDGGGHDGDDGGNSGPGGG
jgi:hypothetical protein